MNVRSEESFFIVSNIFFIYVSLQQRLAVDAKRIFNRCEKSSQNLGCSKTSTSYTSETEEKDYRQSNNECMNLRKRFCRLKHLFHRRDFTRDLQSQQNEYSLDVRNHHRIWDAQKHLLHTLVKLKKKIIDN